MRTRMRSSRCRSRAWGKHDQGGGRNSKGRRRPSLVSRGPAQMERERLARQKRVCGPSPPTRSRSNSSANSDQDDDENESGSEGSARKRARLNTPSKSLHSTKARTFPTGALLPINTRHADSSIMNKPDCIRLSDRKDELSFAILSAFAVGTPWKHLPRLGVRLSAPPLPAAAAVTPGACT
ncbi:hypothetical protein K438DRAFT_453434 [Mycena galopus ATCC 62051]|nr:hypothetical protein K438DRAFT_453434 [Mycena galopus ATCC 62051]